MRLDLSRRDSMRLRLWRRYRREWWWPLVPWWLAILLPVAVAVVTGIMVAGQ